ncbi:hypothetical protein NQ318_011973 [Aromia moschata]|uniref:Uncharacterized protein n=1 Tax=Aromia moschata TaxID=1265417 RepID=A0AAV8XY45_9CUCU|nr:hypothetical protein NQ318_011973 [Aromia moschata]
MKALIGWQMEGDKKPENHPLIVLENILKLKKIILSKAFLEGLSSLLKLLEDNSAEESKETYTEIILPAPETLLIQFSHRTIFNSADACDERLTARYWLAVPAGEGDTDMENITCDLMEICRQHLHQDYNIVKEVEKLCRISRSDNLDDKEKQTDDQKSKMKKPFVTPMKARSFARTVQQRPDLFRSRPPNTSRPPSLHVDDFVALETCGAQPTGPTGYNKISRELLA